MFDLLFIAIAVAFFGVSIGLACLFERLGRR